MSQGTRQQHAMDTSPVDRATAATIEAAEARSWADLYAAAPSAWAAEVGLGSREVGGALAIHWAATGRRYFSRAIGLGVASPATPDAIDAILAGWAERDIAMFLLQSLPHCMPEDYEDLLRARGLEPFDAQDRIVRGGEALGGALVVGERAPAVEEVTPETTEEWSDFLQRTYRLDAGPWLPRLIGRAGWHQYVAREDGAIVAARAMHLGPDGTAWLGMDGPVPGLMTDDHEPDAALCAAIVTDGLARGARRFIADIEAPTEDMDTPAYAQFAALGFRRPYTRTHWTVL
jgi:hypothetical protein